MDVQWLANRYMTLLVAATEMKLYLWHSQESSRYLAKELKQLKPGLHVQSCAYNQ